MVSERLGLDVYGKTKVDNDTYLLYYRRPGVGRGWTLVNTRSI